ncbi:MAG: hypothetical protein AB7K36_22935, partial [Chloroflexota bacterium]
MQNIGPGANQPVKHPVNPSEPHFGADAPDVSQGQTAAGHEATGHDGAAAGGHTDQGALLPSLSHDAAAAASPASSTATPEPSYIVSGTLATGVAATSVAVVTSFTGVQGTMIGAAIGAMLGSLISQIAKRPLMRMEQRLRAVGAGIRDTRWSDIPDYVRATPDAMRALYARIPFRTLGIMATLGIAGFAVAMSGITVLETAQGEPLSAITTGEPVDGTTIGNLLPPLLTENEPLTPTPPPGVGAAASPTADAGLGPAASPDAGPESGPAASPEAAPGAELTATAEASLEVSPGAGASPAAQPEPAASPGASPAPATTPDQAESLGVEPPTTIYPST